MRTIAALTLVTGLVLFFEGARRLAIVGLGIHPSTPPQLAISVGLALLGAFGLLSGISLARLSDRGRKATIVCLVALAGLYFFAGEMSFGGLVRLTVFGASAAFLFGKQARSVCYGVEQVDEADEPLAPRLDEIRVFYDVR